MKTPAIDLNAIQLGPDGTVVLTDDLLAEFASTARAVDAGGDGQVNASTCTNTASCNNSQNGHCSNAAGHCEGAKNQNECMIIVDPG